MPAPAALDPGKRAIRGSGIGSTALLVHSTGRDQEAVHRRLTGTGSGPVPLGGVASAAMDGLAGAVGRRVGIPSDVQDDRSPGASSDPGVGDVASDTGNLGGKNARRWVPGALALVAYLALAVFAYNHTSLFGSARLPQYASGDQVQEVWFLAWPVYAITHGHNPFITTWMNYPLGVNLTDNTSMPLLGILGMPITLTLGPVAAYNLLLVAAFTSSALAMCLVLRRWVRWWPAAFAGGLLYGFSPFMIGEGNGHLFLTFAPLPPIIVLVVDEIVVRQRRRPVRMGLLLGVLAAAEYYISPEVLAMTAVMAGVGVALIAATHPHSVREHADHVVRSLVAGGLLCAAAIAYPLWLTLFGPQHIVGPPHPLSFFAHYPGDLLGGIVPTTSQHLGPASLKATGDRFTSGDVTENGMYLGIPLICVLAGLTWALRKVRVLVFASAMVVCAYALALGPRLTIDGQATGIRMPYTILRHIPFVQDILPVRFSLFIQLFAAMALAIGLDRLWWRTSTWRTRARGPFHHRLPWTVVTSVIAVAALLPLVPQLPYHGAPTAIAPFVVGSGPGQIPANSVVLYYPYPGPLSTQGMLLQAADRMRFKIVGGYSLVPAPGGHGDAQSTVLQPSAPEAIFSESYSGLQPGNRYPPIDPVTVAALRTFLADYRIQTVLLDPVGANPGLVIRYVNATLGPPQRRGEYRAWFDVSQRLTSHEDG